MPESAKLMAARREVVGRFKLARRLLPPPPRKGPVCSKIAKATNVTAITACSSR